ncbi:MAG TPA: ADP-forming succinate--CoA ligase subunit beta [Candidatus Eremiobacteraeota bacterium]|nr:MAG: Succinyl-CoA ligase (ADP-forming) subunit beta [bacterium ADurb.Bin363]HPZ08254.1 ADP-forming succinate--CoA ligase subunit beta [Candidatus Eremiobacteraeota bacterium]
MKIHEYQAKEIFKRYGIPVPSSDVARTPEEVRNLAEKINKSVVIKAQVHVGGRGKAGGIKVASNPKDAFSISKEILGKRLKGLVVEKVLVEEAISIEKEYYLAITMDRSTRKNVIMLSSEGGVDIEEVAVRTPEKIEKLYIDPAFGLQEFEIKRLFMKMNFSKNIAGEFRNFLISLYKLYLECDATLAEINPLVLTVEGKLMAADAKILLDDNSIFRHKEFEALQEIAEDDEIEREARVRNIPYVRLNGDIGIIGNGAGLVMTTLDMVKREGGKPANFLDIGGGGSAGKTRQSLELVTMDKNLNGIFINIFGGITRCDEAAKGIVEAIKSLKLTIPVVIRLIGTRENEGRKLLEDEGYEVGRDMNEGARKIVELAGAYAKGRGRE